MPQKKGHTGNPYGRPKGTPNKVTSTLRNWLLELINNNRLLIQQDFEQLEPLQRMQMLEKLLPFLMPKVESAGAVRGACYDESDVIEIENTFYNEEEQPKRELQLWYEKQAE